MRAGEARVAQGELVAELGAVLVAAQHAHERLRGEVQAPEVEAQAARDFEELMVRGLAVAITLMRNTWCAECPTKSR